MGKIGRIGRIRDKKHRRERMKKESGYAIEEEATLRLESLFHVILSILIFNETHI